MKVHSVVYFVIMKYEDGENTTDRIPENFLHAFHSLTVIAAILAGFA